MTRFSLLSRLILAAFGSCCWRMTKRTMPKELVPFQGVGRSSKHRGAARPPEG